MNDKNFYITTPIYYANDKPHIGHAYTTVLADVINKYQQLLGKETYFLTGTDEHGQKVQQAARQRNIDPKKHVDEFHQRFKDMWELLEIQYDRFIRTTDSDHRAFVQTALQELHDKDEIYSKNYQGWYSVGEERFFSEDELIDGKDPVSGKPVEWLEEKNYFFKMSKYQEKLIKHINDNPEFIMPEFRKNEVLGFLKNELHDLCISRPKSRLEWGIPLPFDDDYVTYVWFDALLNYQSGAQAHTFSNGDSAWPADYHIIGKDILTTHCVYWPTMLMGMGRILPRHILAHGWWLLKDKKMSKSEGNVVNPLDYIKDHGCAKVRYFLMSEMTIGQDASFSDDLFVRRTNTDLANDLGNAVNRVNKLVHSHFEGILPEPKTIESIENEFQKLAQDYSVLTQNAIKDMKLSVATEQIMVIVRAINKYIDTSAPWALAKSLKENPDNNNSIKEKLGTILYTAAEGLRLALTLLSPIIQKKSKQGLAMVGMHDAIDKSHLDWGILKGKESLSKDDALFPRIEVKKEKNSVSPKNKNQQIHPMAKLEFKVATIISVNDHPDADGLYVLEVDDCLQIRMVCAGLKKSYKPGDLLNKKVVLFSNLKPAKLRGVESNGMLLAADMQDDKASLVNPGDIPNGSLLQFGKIIPEPKKSATIKDFQKISIKVKSKKVMFEKNVLHFQDIPVTTIASDDANVR